MPMNGRDDPVLDGQWFGPTQNSHENSAILHHETAGLRPAQVERGQVMKLSRMLMVLGLLVLVAGLAYVGQQAEAPGPAMARAAQKLLDSLDENQKQKISFPFDSKERTNWNFVPLEKDRKPTRKGLRLEEMTAEQKKLTRQLVSTGTSASGYKDAVTIMSLEAILHELEKGKGPTRNPEWYFVTIFGTPSATGKWGWRIEGHHLSLNYTLDKGAVISATPTMFGANPATVKSGDKKGLRTIADSEDLARALFKSLDAAQKKAAHQGKHFPEPQQKTVAPSVGPPVGLVAAKMTANQKATLLKLIQHYANRLPEPIAREELKGIENGGLEKVHFAYSGGSESGEPFTYRLHGPTFVVEFLNTQKDGAGNPANHIHSAWRRLAGDFGITTK